MTNDKLAEAHDHYSGILIQKDYLPIAVKDENEVQFTGFQEKLQNLVSPILANIMVSICRRTGVLMADETGSKLSCKYL